MSYTNKTEFYEIPLPIESDLFNPMDWNESMEAVDTALHTAAIDSDTAVDTANAASDAAAAATSGLEELSSIVSTEKGKLTALTARVTSAENEIDDVRADSSDMITAFNEATATSTHAYAIGDTFIYNNVLYRATAAISVSDTIVPNTNCEAINVESQITEINNKFKDFSTLCEIIGDGVITQSAALDNLFAAISSLHLTHTQLLKCKIGLFPSVDASLEHVLYDINDISASANDIRASSIFASGSVSVINTIDIRTSGSKRERVSIASDGTVTVTDLGSAVLPSSSSFVLVI